MRVIDKRRASSVIDLEILEFLARSVRLVEISGRRFSLRTTSAGPFRSFLSLGLGQCSEIEDLRLDVLKNPVSLPQVLQ